jgi:hypothetical protein
MTAVVANQPDGFCRGLPEGEGPADMVLVFVSNAAAMPDAVAAAERYRDGGRLWVAYPKKSGRLRSDIDRDHGWEAMKAAGLLPVTQVAIDQDWSALRWRRRSEFAKITRRAS